ncbi:MAG: SBBP repeat-containing protein, partial [Nitrospirota bacterium]
FVTLKYSAAGALLWQARYDTDFNTGGGETPYDMAVDPAGNVYVVGTRCVAALASGICTDSEYVTIKYDSLDGSPLWVRFFDGSDVDIAEAVVLDPAGNVYVAGETNTDSPTGVGNFVTIKYDASGNELWTRQTAPPSEYPFVVDLALDPSGGVYLFAVRSFKFEPGDYRIIKYDTDGNELWTMATDDRFDAAAVDGAGNIYVTGPSKNLYLTPRGFYTYKYDSSGNRLWTAYYAEGSNVLENPTAIAVDGAGNVIVTGESWHGTLSNPPDSSLDYATVKYSGDGAQLWAARYARGNANTPLDLAVDVSGNSYVTGRSHNGRDYDFATVKYDPEGNQLWEVRYDHAGSTAPVVISMEDGGDVGKAIAVDPAGNVYVAGSSQSTAGDLDMATITYAASSSPPALPDLIMSALSTTTTNVAPSGGLDLANTVTNQGSSAAGPFVIAFHLSADSVYGGTDDIAFNYATASINGTPPSWRIVPGLGAGQSSAYPSLLTVPAGTPQGDYYLCALADVYDVSVEEQEGNNSACTATTIFVSPQVPAVSSVSPYQVTYGIEASKAVTINGVNFVLGSTITIGGLSGTTVGGTAASASNPFVYVNSGRLSFWWPNTSLAPGAYNVDVTLPAGAGGFTGRLPSGFTVNAPQPAVSSISPAAVTYGIDTSRAITIYGSNFLGGAVISLGSLTGTTVAGTSATATNPFVYINSTRLSVWWPNTSLAPGAYGVQVTNPSAAGGLSATLAGGFTVAAPQPAITSTSPSPVTYGVSASQSVTISGSRFMNGATITVGSLSGATVAGSTASATVRYVYTSSSQVKFWWPNTALAPGAYTVTVTNPAAAGGLSASLTAGFTVNAPQPSVASVTPATVTYGVSANQSVTISGSNFANGATITVGSLTGTTVAGSIASATVRYVYTSSSQVKFWWPNTALAPGSYAVTVTNPAAAGGLGATLAGAFTVNPPQPTVSSVSPTPLRYGVDASRALTINGSNFVNGATITLGSLSGATVAGSMATATVRYVYVNSTRLSVWWPNTALAPGAYTVTVTNPAAAGGLGATLAGAFTVQPAQPAITSLSPATVTYGVTTSRSITIYGSNFLLGSTITIQGPGGTLSGVTVSGSSATATVRYVYTNGTQVKFWWPNTSLPAGTYDVTVANPAASGGLSTTLVGGFVVQ